MLDIAEWKVRIALYDSADTSKDCIDFGGIMLGGIPCSGMVVGCEDDALGFDLDEATLDRPVLVVSVPVQELENLVDRGISFEVVNENTSLIGIAVPPRGLAGGIVLGEAFAFETVIDEVMRVSCLATTGFTVEAYDLNWGVGVAHCLVAHGDELRDRLGVPEERVEMVVSDVIE